MPRYMVTDRRTGQRKQMNWSGPNRPSRQDIDSFFAEQEEPSMLSKIWERVNEPLTDAPSRAARWLGENLRPDWADSVQQTANDYVPGLGTAMAMGEGFARGSLEGAGDVLSSFTSPLSVGLTAATLGGNLAGSAGYQGLSRIGLGLARAGGTGMAGHGLYRTATGDNLADRGAGLVEIAGGILGARGATPRRVASPVEPPPVIRGLLAERNPQTRFFAGEAGIADATQKYPIEMTTRPSLGVADLQGRKKGPTLTNMEIGEQIDLPPEIAAQQGFRGPGQPMRPPVMNEFEAMQDALVPERFKIARPGYQTEARPGDAYPEVMKPIYNGPREEKSVGFGKSKKAQKLEKKRIALGIPKEEKPPIVEAPPSRFPEISEPNYSSLSLDDLRVQAEAFKEPAAIAELERRQSGGAGDSLTDKLTGLFSKVNEDERGAFSFRGIKPVEEFKKRRAKKAEVKAETARLMKMTPEELEVAFADRRQQFKDESSKAFGQLQSKFDELKRELDSYDLGLAELDPDYDRKLRLTRPELFENKSVREPNASAPPQVEDPFIRDETGNALAYKKDNATREVRPTVVDPPVTDKRGGRSFGQMAEEAEADRIARLGKKSPTIELLDVDNPLNASGESAASAEALSRQAGMKSRGQQFGVYDRAGNFRPLIGPEAVDYVPRKGETYGIREANGGFRSLNDNGGKVPLKDRMKSESGALSLGRAKKAEDAPDYGNAFHRKTGHKEFDEEAFPNWVNERRASKVEGILRSREFKDLDGKGVEGIFEFQDNQGQGKFSKLTQYFDEAHNRAEQAGIRMGFKENYLPQLWENGKDEIFEAARKLGLKPQFTMKSVIENYRKGVEYGLKPKFQNLSELAGWYEGRLTKAIADRKFFDYLKSKDLIRPKGGAKTPAHWTSLDPDHFPINKFVTKGKEKDIIYQAEPRVAKAINNYLQEPEGTSQKVADFMSLSKNLALSAGVPGTGVNAHGFNILHRNQVANGLLRGTAQGLKYMVNPKAAKDYLDVNLEKAPFAVKHGLTLTTEDHVIGSSGSTELGKGLGGKALNWVLEKHGKFFEDPLFQKMIPALKLEHFYKTFDEMKGKMPEQEAARTAAKFTNEVYGGINWEEMQRDRTLQNWLRSVILAPDWAESNVRIAGGAAKGLNPKSKEGQAYRRLIRGMMATYISANVANKTTSGHWMWENDPGHTFQIEIGRTKEGEKRYISFAGTAGDWIRLPYDTAAALRKGDLSAATRIIKNRTSTGAHALINILWNQDNMGRPILGKDTFGRKQTVKKQVGNLAREAAEPVLPQYVQAPIDYGMGRSGLESSLAAGSEMPLKYQRTGRKRGRKSPAMPRVPSVAMPRIPQ